MVVGGIAVIFPVLLLISITKGRVKLSLQQFLGCFSQQSKLNDLWERLQARD